MLLLKLENEVNFDTIDVTNIRYFSHQNVSFYTLKSVTNEDGNEIFQIPAHEPYEKNSDELEALLHTLHDLTSE